MTDLLSIGANAVSNYQQALSTVSNNIANMNTDGYSRQVANIGENVDQRVGQFFVGTGAIFDGVTRAYDAFTQASVYSSYSSLNTQTPIAQYSNQLVDIMGSSQTSLAPALDQFFSSANILSAQPSSNDLRSQFLQSASGLASRFNLVAGQMTAVDNATQNEISSSVDKLNTYCSQLSVINQQLAQNNIAAHQPSELLDQRDTILTNMSKLAGIEISTRANGEVNVGLGQTSGPGLIVDGGTARKVGIDFSATDPGKVQLIVDPFGSKIGVVGLSSGSLAGLISFRSQGLVPAQAKLDQLAQTTANAINAIQTSGTDGNGQPGAPMFAINPGFIATPPTSVTGLTVNVSAPPNTPPNHDALTLTFDQSHGQWTVKDITTGVSVTAPNNLQINGMTLTIQGAALNQQVLHLAPSQSPAAGIQMVLTDPLQVATGGLFSVLDNPNNASNAQASISVSPVNTAPAGPAAINQIFVNNLHPSAGIASPSSQGLSAVTTIPAGFKNVSLLVNSPPPGSLDLQVFTQDGRQLMGTALTPSQQNQLLQPANGFVNGATYSSQYLNQSAPNSYLGLNYFYGASASSSTDPNTGTFYPASMQSGPTPITQAGLPVNSNAINEGAVVVNGQALGNLVVPSGGLRVNDLANWINQATSKTGVTATAVNVISIPASQLQLNKPNTGLTINGIAIASPVEGFTSPSNLVDAINGAQAGVSASLAGDGSLNIANNPTQGGDLITIGSGINVNALGLTTSTQTFYGQLSFSSPSQINIGLGANGTSANLAQLGLRYGDYFQGSVPENLIVFATGQGPGSIAASYTSGTVDSTMSQRQNPLAVNFISKTSYTITDKNTGTVVAQRTYDPNVGISYGHLQVTLSGAPIAGDEFDISGNQNGIGSNDNLARMVQLQKNTSLLPGGVTLNQSYNNNLSAVGNIATQASVSQQALQVVNDQAVQARATSSGVDMNTEAANLIRFQQAYQAAAKSIQIANTLFTTITQLN